MSVPEVGGPYPSKPPFYLSAPRPCPKFARSQLIPDGVVSVTGAGQGAAWAMKALWAQSLLAAWALVARLTLAGTRGG